MSRYIEVRITCPSEEEGLLVARALVERRFAASVYVVPIQSFYHWENQLCDDSEALLLAKTKDELFEDHIIPTVKSMHSYEVFDITAVPIVDGDLDYLSWIDDQLVTSE